MRNSRDRRIKEEPLAFLARAIERPRGGLDRWCRGPGACEFCAVSKFHANEDDLGSEK